MTAISALAGASLYFDSNIFINALESPERAMRKRLGTVSARIPIILLDQLAAG